MTTSGFERQAVVVIHGIGEGRPMATARGFTAGVAASESGARCYVSHPDRISKSMELHTLRFPPRSAGGETLVTDVYECYWAQRMRDTKLRHVIPWVIRLLATPPIRARALVWIYRTGALLLISIALIYGIVQLPELQLTYKTVTSGVIGVLVAGLTGWLTQRYVIGYIGDAARYLTPDVDNINQRAAIRKDARDLLVRLHESLRYDRIVVVGHSLGSVIAYDVIGRLWDEYRDRFGSELRIHDPSSQNSEDLRELKIDVSRTSQEELDKLEDSAFELRQCENNDVEVGKQLPGFRKQQKLLWQEQHNLKNPWLITDLITLGSPLAHAVYLTKVGGDDLEKRFESREYPKCPPLNDVWTRTPEQCAAEREDRSISYSPTGKKWVRLIVPSAVFGFVRWTNIYFPGDVIGGPVRNTFGAGVKDVRVRRNTGTLLGSKLRAMCPTSHTKYWKAERGYKGDDKEAVDKNDPTAILEIRNAIGLNELSGK
jgi:hypothetical protein